MTEYLAWPYSCIFDQATDLRALNFAKQSLSKLFEFVKINRQKQKTNKLEQMKVIHFCDR